MKKLYFILLSMLAFFSIGEATEESFIVGTTSGYAPYVSLNEKGEYEGFDIDLARLIAKRLKKQLVLRDLGSMPSLLMALQKKKIEAAIWAISITEARQKEMTMIRYQGEDVSDISFLFWKKIPEGIQSIQDLKSAKKPICVESGSYQDSILSQYPDVKTRSIDKIFDGIMEIQYGKAYAVPVDHSLVSYFTSRYPALKVLRLPLPFSQQSFGNGICLHKSNEVLASQVKKIVEELKREGKIAELEKKWKLSH